MQAATVYPTLSIPGKYWQWRGHSIYYVHAGEKHTGRPALLLVHGFGASTDHWRKNIAQLSENFDVYAIDLLGYGRSAKPKLEYGGNLWRDQLHDFITEVIGNKAILAGNSLGGYASLCLAAQRPDAAVGLILLNSAGPFSDTDSSSEPEAVQSEIQPPKQPDMVQRLFGEMGKQIFKLPLAQFLMFQYARQRWVIRQTLEKVYLDKSAITDQLVEDIYRPSCDEGAFDVFASMFSTPQGEKVDILLQQLTCPLLILWGEGDPWMNARERSKQFHRYYPNLTEHFLNAGHCPHDEIPDQVNALIKEWALKV